MQGSERANNEHGGSEEDRRGLAPEDQPTVATTSADQETPAPTAAEQETLAPQRQYTTPPREISPQEETLLSIGGHLGPYRIVRLLGKGGMGEVYEAEHTESDRRVALKVLGRSLGLPEDRQRFLREGKLAAQISHPHCVYIYGTEEIDGILVISMELVTGGTLKERVDEEGPLAVTEAVDAVLQMIDGLEATERASSRAAGRPDEGDPPLPGKGARCPLR